MGMSGFAGWLRRSALLAAGPRQGEMPALVGEALAGERQTDDVDGLAHAAQRVRERLTVQPLDDLRTADSEAEDEAVVAQAAQGEGSLGDQGGGADADLQDAAGQQDAFGFRRQIRQWADAVGSPGFGDEAHRGAEAFGFLHVGDGVVP